MPSQVDRFSPHVSDLIVRPPLENSQAFLNHLLILPIGREQEKEVIGEFKAAGLASGGLSLPPQSGIHKTD